jgi:hypothetical protein
LNFKNHGADWLTFELAAYEQFTMRGCTYRRPSRDKTQFK